MMFGIIILMLLTALYWIVAVLLVIFGIIKQNKKYDEKVRNSAKMRMIAGIIMLIIGLGFCGNVYGVF